MELEIDVDYMLLKMLKVHGYMVTQVVWELAVLQLKIEKPKPVMVAFQSMKFI